MNKENIDFDNVDEIVSNFDNLDTYVKYLLIDRLENSEEYDFDEIESVQYLADVLFDGDFADGALFMYTRDNEKFLGHFGEQVIMVLNQLQDEIGKVDGLNINNLILNVVQTVAERILNFVADAEGNITNKNLAKVIDNLKKLDDYAMDFISD